VVFHKPQIVEAHLVGQLALLYGFLVQRIPVDVLPLKRALHLVEYAKLH
jgi:hypothetical protein